MTNRETEEKLRKLASIDREAAKKGWQFYLSGEGKDREEIIDIASNLRFSPLSPLNIKPTSINTLTKAILLC